MIEVRGHDIFPPRNVLAASDWLIFFKLAFIGLFLFITGPTATHAVAKATLSLKNRKKNLLNVETNSGEKMSP